MMLYPVSNLLLLVIKNKFISVKFYRIYNMEILLYTYFKTQQHFHIIIILAHDNSSIRF